MKLILQIALGVSLGIVLGGSLLHLYTGGFTEQMIGTALKQAAVQNTPVQPKASVVDDLLAGNIPATPTQPVAPKPIEPATPQQISVTAQNKPIAEIKVAGNTIISGSPTDLEEQQKAAKFKTYYQKSEKCQAPDHYSHDTLVACGNEYIRAKAKFEELWQQGKFKN